MVAAELYSGHWGRMEALCSFFFPHLSYIINIPWLKPLGPFFHHPVVAQVGEFGFAAVCGIH